MSTILFEQPSSTMRRFELLAHTDELVDRIGRVEAAPVAGSALRSLLNAARCRLDRSTSELRRDIESAHGETELRELAAALRAAYGLVAGLEGAAEWHSPAARATLSHDLDARAVATDHAYRRDRCPAVGDFERSWLRTCVERGPTDSSASDDATGERPLRALAFANGMAAIASVLTMLADEGHRFVPAANLYHETRWLLEREPFRRLVEPIDVGDLDAVVARADRRSAAVLIDAQANGPSLEPADWPRLLGALGRCRRPVTLVIDTTVTSVGTQPFRHHRSPWVRLITIESLTKTAQLGLDRVAAGMVVTDPRTAAELDIWREHLGTGAVAAVIRQLPRPSMPTLCARLARHEANAEHLAAALRSTLAGTGLSVVHPCGQLVTVAGRPEPWLRALIDRVMALAATERVPMAEGTSFGFDTTRLALIVADGTVPFVRIAAGAGPSEEIDGVADVIARVVQGLGCDRA